jgi:hypothetical protein
MPRNPKAPKTIATLKHEKTQRADSRAQETGGTTSLFGDLRPTQSKGTNKMDLYHYRGVWQNHMFPAIHCKWWPFLPGK